MMAGLIAQGHAAATPWSMHASVHEINHGNVDFVCLLVIKEYGESWVFLQNCLVFGFPLRGNSVQPAVTYARGGRSRRIAFALGKRRPLMADAEQFDAVLLQQIGISQ